jgi:hypothetical protein
MNYLHLQPHVSFAIVEGDPVFLDLKRDRYFGLEGIAARAFARLCSEPERALDDEAASSLLATGLFGVAAEPVNLSPTDIIPADRELPTTGTAGPAPADLIEIAYLLGWARRALRSQPLDRLIGRCRQRRKHRPPSSTDDAVKLACRFRRARPWAPVKPSCLQDSLALHAWLTRRGTAAELVLGVKLNPFAAHCWLQLDGIVLNDSPETIGAFTPIVALQ